MNTTTFLGDKPINRIGYGAMQLAGPGVFGPPCDPSAARAVLRRAIELGVDHIDTSQYYGPDVVNDLIREALHPYPENLKLVTKVGARRDDAGRVFPAQRPDELREGVEANLRSLRVERLDLVNLRLVQTGGDAAVPLEEQLAALEDMRREGKLDLIGLSNVDQAKVQLALEFVDVAGIQNGYSIIDRRDDELVDCAREREIAFVPFAPLGSALRGGPARLAGDPAIVRVADKHGATPTQIALAWLLARYDRMLLIPGTSSVAHLEENVAAIKLELDDADLAALDRVEQLLGVAENHHDPVRTAHLGRGDPAAGAREPAGPGRRRSHMKLVVNGVEVEVDDRQAKTPLLWVLRDVLGLRGTKFGCGAGFCAACTVLLDGHNVKSCQTATERAVGKAVTTVEGASGPVVDAVRDAWHRGNVVQCGYCQPGQTLAALSLLESDPSPDDAKIDTWMSGNLCRCGTYPRIRAAIHAAAGTLSEGPEPAPLIAPDEIEDRTLTADELVDPVHPYVRIHSDGTVVAYSSQIEMGQGIHTGLATIVAEELDADFDSVRVVNAANGRGPNGDVYGNPDLGSAFQLTGASNSMKGFWVRYRLAAAQARARLVAAAAEAWTVPAAEVETENGVARHAQSGRQASFGELAARAGQLAVPDGVQPKEPADYKLIGREGRLRVDAVPKILGATRYTIDVTVPGMLTALVLHPPRFGATAASVDDEAALAEPGVTAVVPIEEGVAVVAETVADAQRGLRALVVEWDDTNAERRSTDELLAEHLRLLESGENAVTARDEGDVDAALAEAASTVDGTYTLPYLAHAPMEPNNAACRMREDGVLEVWVGSEAPEYVKMNASSIAGIDKEQVEVHITFAGGSFGLHSSAERDPTAEAVQIARALDWKHPIKVQSLREEEFKVGRYRAMVVHRVRAGADADGRLTAWHQQIVAEPTSVNLPFVRDVMFTNNVDFFTTTGAVDPPYAVENFRLESTNFESRIPTMVWRSVGNSHTEFARESAIDELAIAAGRDPVDLRRELLAGSPRTLRALEVAAARADWGSPLPEGRARGITSSGFLGHSAQVTEVSLDDRGRVHVDRIVFALDCGRNVNPDLIRAQVEGGLLWGLSAASWGEIVLGESGDIVTQNFDAYPVMRMRSVPQMEVHLIESAEPPTGVGEVSVPSVAPALANAIAALTGTRIRQLPLSRTIKIY